MGSSLGDEILKNNSGSNIGVRELLLSGTQALVQATLIQKERDEFLGLNTAGYITGYRGSPLGSVDKEFNKSNSFLAEKSIFFHEALNEDLAATALWGSQQSNLNGEGKHDGVFGLWYGKGPGVDRSGDALRHANLAGTSKFGGVVMVMGDDHTGESSTTLHQSDYGLIDSMIPIFSPSGVQEIIDYSVYGWSLSRFAGVWVGLKCIKDTVEVREIVNINSTNILINKDTTQKFSGKFGIRLNDTPFEQEERIHNQKLPAVKYFVRKNNIDKGLFKNEKSTIGIVSAGKNWLDLMSSLAILGLNENKCKELGITCYKIGVIWPLEDQNFKTWAKNLKTIIIIEEKRKILEDQIKNILFNENKRPNVYGEFDENGNKLFPSSYSLNPNQIVKVISSFVYKTTNHKLRKINPSEGKDNSLVQSKINYDPRKPYFCAGCPHNSSTVIPEGSRAYAGIGCHYMVQWMDRSTVGYTHMGGEGANWIGEAQFSKRDHIFQNIGDGTYNHSGLQAIRAAIAAGVNITYKILFNDAVAMTGGQKNDGSLDPLKIIRELNAFGVKKIVGVYDPKEEIDFKSYKNLVELKPREQLLDVQKALQKIKGVSAIVYIQTCAAEKRRRRKLGTFPNPKETLYINPEVCEGCGDCGIQSNCVAILPLETRLGRKRYIDQSSCNKDFSCLGGFCPSFVSLEIGNLKKEKSLNLKFKEIPEPKINFEYESTYNIVFTGIGGTGIVTMGTILALAAKTEKKYVGIMEMAGLAQKGGEVHVHCKISNSSNKINSIRVDSGQANVIIGGDLVVTAAEKTLSLSNRFKTALICNSNELITGDFTRNPQLQIKSNNMKLSLISNFKKKSTWFINSTEIAKSNLDNTIYSNLVLLGYAFQAGLIPLKLQSIFSAIKFNSKKYMMNLNAFNLGRKCYIDNLNKNISTNDVRTEEQKVQNADTFQFRKSRLEDFGGSHIVNKFVKKVNKSLEIDKTLGKAVSDGYFNVLYNKDEYEVARLHVKYLKENLDLNFKNYKNLNFFLAPPILNFIKVNGRPKKFKFGGWIYIVFYLLMFLKPLRNSIFDIFSLSKERKMERQLLVSYEKDLEFIFKNFNNENKDLLIEIARLPSKVLGFGPVKIKSIDDHYTHRNNIYNKLSKLNNLNLNAAE